MWHYHREYLPPRPIDAFVECTSVTIFFPSTRTHLVQTTENTRLPVGTQALSGLPMPLTISAKLFLSFQVKVHGFPIEEAINSPSRSIPAGRSNHQVELLAMSDI
ncbi:hypothetical protein L210DRAFT_954963 [Boletus edulis BED1]|uniref:Uncharacterized protein n=1 Tax=Boletus edulis BED1 TaxID=1328754 RepID=A0AAD4GB03_BOLED|nr:hypothetical protein L210DRAFT_954963 [Boletus edulis BED1]